MEEARPPARPLSAAAAVAADLRTITSSCRPSPAVVLSEATAAATPASSSLIATLPSPISLIASPKPFSTTDLCLLSPSLSPDPPLIQNHHLEIRRFIAAADPDPPPPRWNVTSTAVVHSTY
ncbi:hypothetical protein HYC85_001140 [Camellia sinensis]|uniref:Uncharacterized protein n=1 Tax=Camellia sinensis TaxID=4442 RepID=A0A7J7I5R8_CAMSI|nr:hypothetical protein HYC85_001140 [Camellia sinensis]